MELPWWNGGRRASKLPRELPTIPSLENYTHESGTALSQGITEPTSGPAMTARSFGASSTSPDVMWNVARAVEDKSLAAIAGSRRQ